MFPSVISKIKEGALRELGLECKMSIRQVMRQFYSPTDRKWYVESVRSLLGYVKFSRFVRLANVLQAGVLAILETYRRLGHDPGLNRNIVILTCSQAAINTY